MTDREKREKILEEFERFMQEYDRDIGFTSYDSEVIKGVHAWLKSQEPVEPKVIDTANSKLYRNDMFKNYYCGNCGEYLHVVNRRDMFCSQCGRKVKWE